MATTAQTIVDAAIASSLANDDGRSDLANDLAELLGVLNRRIREIYTLAGMPREYGGMGRGDYFATSVPVALGGGPVALPAAAFRHVFETTQGARVAVVSRADLADEVAEMPPAVVVEQLKVSGAGRPGDPISGEVVIVRLTPLPGLLTLGTHYVGATLPADASTSQWPEAGDSYLVTWLARYLAIKAGDRDPDEMQALEQQLTDSAALLGALIGVDGTRLADSGSDDR